MCVCIVIVTIILISITTVVVVFFIVHLELLHIHLDALLEVLGGVAEGVVPGVAVRLYTRSVTFM